MATNPIHSNQQPPQPSPTQPPSQPTPPAPPPPPPTTAPPPPPPATTQPPPPPPPATTKAQPPPQINTLNSVTGASPQQITTRPGIVTTPYSQINPTPEATSTNAHHGAASNSDFQNNSSDSMSPGLIVGLGIAGILVVGLIAFFVRKRLKVLKSNKHRSFLNDDFNEMFNVASTEQHTANSNANGGNTRNLNSSVSNSRTNNDGRRVHNVDLNTNRSNSRPLNNMMSSPTNRPLTNNNRGDERVQMTSRMNNNRGGGGVYNFNNSGSNRPWPQNNHRPNDISIINNRVNVSSPLASPPLTTMNNVYSNKLSEVTTPYHPAISVEQPSFGRPPPPPLGTPYVHGVSLSPPPYLSPENNNNLGGYGAEIRSNNINIIPSSTHQQYQQYTFPPRNNEQLVTSGESKGTSNVNNNITLNRNEGIPQRENTLGGKSFGSFDYGDYGEG